ncbi:MAG: hypothetical protein ABIP78_07960 [Pyrinomonadaceae bacterium]
MTTWSVSDPRRADPVEVFKELSEAVDEVIEIFLSDGKPLPERKNVVLQAA